MAWYSNLSFSLRALISGAIAAFSWCLIFLVYQFARSLLRSSEEKNAIEKAQRELEAKDVGTYHPPSSGDDRSPCPALNTMANHGYLPRSGRNITGAMLVHALQRAYNLSTPLAYLLTYGGLLLLSQVGAISLSDTARHNRIEHNASLFHTDTEEGNMYAPKEVDEDLWKKFIGSIEEPSEGLSVRDLAKCRVRREAETGKENTTPIGREIARGEVALVFHIFGREFPSSISRSGSVVTERKVPVDVLTTFFHDERLPEGWKPTKQTTLLETVRKAREIRLTMGKVRKESSLVE